MMYYLNVSKWKIVYYEESSGKCPVLDFIDSLKVANQAKVASRLSLLEEKGPVLLRPYADILRNGIHELRFKLSGFHRFNKHFRQIDIQSAREADTIIRDVPEGFLGTVF